MISETLQLYEGKPNVTLTSYILNDSFEMQNGKPRPVVLICPGGGYMNCSDREAEPVALRFAAMGYHAFVLRYSNYNLDFSKGFIGLAEVKPEVTYPAPMRDIAKAVLHIKDNAALWCIDPNKLVICGFSAGAHNCAMYSVYWNDPIITGYFGRDAEDFRPAAAILGYGIYNYHFLNSHEKNEFDSEFFKAANLSYFGTRTPTDEQLSVASPVAHVSKDTPPCFLWATSEDPLVLVHHTCEFSLALAKQGIAQEVHIFEKGGHGLSLASQASAGSKMDLQPNAANWIPAVESWLNIRFSLELPDVPPWMSQLSGEN